MANFKSTTNTPPTAVTRGPAKDFPVDSFLQNAHVKGAYALRKSFHLIVFPKDSAPYVLDLNNTYDTYVLAPKGASVTITATEPPTEPAYSISDGATSSFTPLSEVYPPFPFAPFKKR